MDETGLFSVARRRTALEDWLLEVGAQGAAVEGDVADRSRLDTLVTQIAEPFGPPDIVVHAAGLKPHQPADEVTEEAWEATLAVNLSAPFFLTRAFIPHMKAQNWGRVVNFASLQSFRAFPAGIAYGAFKGGVAQLTRAMTEA